MPFDTQKSILPIHAYSIIRDSDHRRSTALHFHCHMRGFGIETIFDQLADNSSRPLHDLTGRHLTGECVRENAYFRHNDEKS
jgi:hypothetical protein